jgi:hypothetical protein
MDINAPMSVIGDPDVRGGAISIVKIPAEGNVPRR